MPHPIINIAEIEPQPRPAANTVKGPATARYDARMGPISPRIGAQKLGYNLTAVAPGMRAFPFHNHRLNEEMFFIIEGSGEVRIGNDVHPIRAGDIIACPPGGKETAHQIVNTGTTELRYLAVSTMQYPEIAEYPDSGKFGVFTVLGSGPDGQPQRLRFIGRENQALDYWDGE